MVVAALAVAIHAAHAGIVPADTGRPELRHGSRVPPHVAAVPITAAISLDGRLDEPSWRRAPIATGFTQVFPDDGAPPSESTEVRILYDRTALYVGARMYDSAPELIAPRIGRRDGNTASDLLWVNFDSYHDHRTVFAFAVNPAGVRRDEIATNDLPAGDASWDPVWSVATRVDSLGWVAELRTPFSQLRFAGDAEMIWGLNFSRLIFRKNEFVRWSWVPNTEQGFSSHFGHLAGLLDLPQPRRLEMLPYAVVTSDHREGLDATDPFHDGSAQDLTVGLDLKYGVTSNLTLDATVNRRRVRDDGRSDLRATQGRSAMADPWQGVPTPHDQWYLGTSVELRRHPAVESGVGHRVRAAPERLGASSRGQPAVEGAERQGHARRASHGESGPVES